MPSDSRVIPVNDAYIQLRLEWDADRGALWYYLLPRSRPCFNPGLLAELRAFQDDLVRVNAAALEQGRPVPIRYVILAGGIPGVFNLGGDLALFAQLIRRQDRTSLLRYATACIDVLYPNAVAFDQPVTTITLVRGDALAGGFEAAISSNIVIAEKSARFGLPEVLFNLIPGMGAYTFLSRRVSPDVAERLIMCGEMLSAEHMLEMQLVEKVVDDGKGEDAVRDYIDHHHKHANAQAALRRVKQLVNPVTYEELIGVTRIWVDAALQLSDRDLRIIERIVRAQNRSFCEPEAPRARAAEA